MELSKENTQPTTPLPPASDKLKNTLIGIFSHEGRHARGCRIIYEFLPGTSYSEITADQACGYSLELLLFKLSQDEQVTEEGLNIAALAGNIEVMVYLVESCGMKISSYTYCCAIQSNNVDAVKYIVSLCPCGHGQLHPEALSTKSVRFCADNRVTNDSDIWFVRPTARKDFNLSKQKSCGNYFIHKAMVYGSVEVLEYLLQTFVGYTWDRRYEAQLVPNASGIAQCRSELPMVYGLSETFVDFELIVKNRHVHVLQFLWDHTNVFYDASKHYILDYAFRYDALEVFNWAVQAYDLDKKHLSRDADLPSDTVVIACDAVDIFREIYDPEHHIDTPRAGPPAREIADFSRQEIVNHAVIMGAVKIFELCTSLWPDLHNDNWFNRALSRAKEKMLVALLKYDPSHVVTRDNIVSMIKMRMGDALAMLIEQKYFFDTELLNLGVELAILPMVKHARAVGFRFTKQHVSCHVGQARNECLKELAKVPGIFTANAIKTIISRKYGEQQFREVGAVKYQPSDAVGEILENLVRYGGYTIPSNFIVIVAKHDDVELIKTFYEHGSALEDRDLHPSIIGPRVAYFYLQCGILPPREYYSYTKR